jgi:hypothetical protein
MCEAVVIASASTGLPQISRQEAWTPSLSGDQSLRAANKKSKFKICPEKQTKN